MTTTPGAPSEREAIESIRDLARNRIEDGKEMGAAVWRIALEDIDREATQALAALRPPAPESDELLKRARRWYAEMERSASELRAASPDLHEAASGTQAVAGVLRDCIAALTAKSPVPESGEVTQGDYAIARQMLADQYVLEGGGAEITEAIRQDDQVLIRDDTAIRAMVAYAHRLASLDALRPAGEGERLREAVGSIVSMCADHDDVYPDAASALEGVTEAINELYGCIEDGVFSVSPAPATDALREVVGLHFANVVDATPTPTPPPEEVAGLVERLRGLLNAGAPESDSGWFVGSYTEAGLSVITDGLRHGMFQVVAETPQATLITEAINALPTLLDAIASLSAQVAGKEEEIRVLKIEAGGVTLPAGAVGKSIFAGGEDGRG